MPLRPPGEGRRAAPQRNLLLAFAFILLPWLQLADAQQQQRHHQPAAYSHHQPPPPDSNLNNGPVGDDPVVPGWAATSDNPLERRKSSSSPPEYSDDESALATLAPALKAVRAPHPSRHLGSGSSSPASGLASPQNARNLRDWEVEDFVLLATVDGDLYANDRKTGQQRWHLEVDQPMVETHHHRANNSVLDDDYNPVDHYIWAVEPNNDGGLYLWNPEAPGPVRTGFTMKRLVESMVPYASDDPPVVYTGKKETTMITLDAATGRVLKWFSSGGSHVNEAESCLQQNTLYDTHSQECSSSAATITLGRTEYTVGIQRLDGRPVATLKYSEWGPNRFDNDLYQQYHSTLDDRYIASQHDGKIYAFDYRRTGKIVPIFSHQFVSPVARVLDVCRPIDALTDSLVILPQPVMPWEDENIVKTRIFLNHTESGSWYAMSGRAYPLIGNAPLAQISRPDWSLADSPWDTISEARLSKALVGIHFLGSGGRRNGGQSLSLPPGAKLGGEVDDVENDSIPPPPTVSIEGGDTPPNIITTFKALPKSAANSVVNFISNPVLILLLVGALFYHEKKLRQSYHRFRATGSLKETLLFLTSDGSESIRDESSSDHDVFKREQPSFVTELASTDKTAEPEAAKEDELAKPHVVKPTETADTAFEKVADDVKDKPATDDQASVPKEADAQQTQGSDSAGAPTDAPPEKKKKAHRGRRGGVKHRKGRAREGSQSRGDDTGQTTVEDAVRNAKKLGDRPSLEPDVMTVANDVQAVSGPIIRMGNIEVNMDDQLGTGSNGTLVFAGKFDGREVAVKRMLIQFYDIASQETRLLRESDDHPNVIRYYSQQMRDGFLYIALERCAASLADVVEKPHVFRDLANAGRMDLPAVLYQITNGISHLHQLRIVHRDLKPQNILVNMGKDGKPRLLVSDFGLCKKLEGGQSSFGATTGRAAGTSGWRAPELLLDDDARDAGVVDISTHSGSGSVLVNDHLSPNSRRATRAIDIFSLGLVFFYVLTNGSHPFDCGDRYMREVNIRKGNYNLRPLDALGDFAYEAEDLIESMLQADPKRRPNAREVMSHPFFWSAKKRLAFLCDVSDHFEKEPRDPPSPALVELERHAASVTKNDFLRQLPREFVDSLGKQRKYTGTKLLDLLRALRNKRNHYEDMPDNLKRTVGALPDGYLAFWTVRFPMLLLVCWNVVYNVQWEETDRFREYYVPAGL